MHKLHAALVSLFVAAAVALGAPTASSAAVAVSVDIAPPALPVYDQPPIPGPGYIWTPGYWAWGPVGYYWVPGTWVLPPAVGLLWTPGYWAWGPGGFVFNVGYWGPTVGFYGGINYGFGYFGVGFGGGYWSNGQFFYNRSVTNISNTRITNVYNRDVTVNRVTRVAYNGGRGGTTARPTPAEIAAAQGRHIAPSAAQLRQERLASTNQALRASFNHGDPAIAATARPGEFARGVVPAHSAVATRAAAGVEHRPSAATGAAERAMPRAPHAGIEQRRAAQPRAMQERAAREPAFERRAAQERAMQQRAAHGRAFERHAPQAWAAQHRGFREPAFERRGTQAWAAPHRAVRAFEPRAPHARMAAPRPRAAPQPHATAHAPPPARQRKG
jgi:hypothetical protein